VAPAEDEFSEVLLIFELPLENNIKLPLFEPVPSCGYTNDVLTYEFVSSQPDWLDFDQEKRTVLAKTSDE